MIESEIKTPKMFQNHNTLSKNFFTDGIVLNSALIIQLLFKKK